MVAKKLWKLAGIALATIALTGCGRGATPTATSAKSLKSVLAASQIVGLPTNYQAGVPVPGVEGTPSVLRVNWPRVSRTADGTLSDPVNLVVCGTERHLRHVFSAAGWVEADPTNLLTAARTIKTSLLGGEYATSPMSDLYLYNRKQDLALQKNANGTRSRDHLRVWQTPLQDRLGRPVWVVAATEDIAIKLAPGAKLPTHQISPFIDDERQLVVDDFLKSGHVAMRYQLQSLEPNFRGVNGGGDFFTTDGKAEVLELVPMKFN
jgi:hypothetical protein